MRYDLVIFDLDGTILNTLDDLCDACNQTMLHFSYPTHTKEEVRKMVGGGVGKLIRRAVPKSVAESEYESALNWFRTYYAAHAQVKTAPYPGIEALLKDLRAENVHVACNSNKFDSAVRALCDQYFAGYIEMAVGEREGVPRKPAPDAVYGILDHFHIKPSRALYVGDSDVDILTAQNAGIDCAWVSWGFRCSDELGSCTVYYAFDTAKDLRNFILE